MSYNAYSTEHVYTLDNVQLRLARQEEWSNDETQIWWNVRRVGLPGIQFEIYWQYGTPETFPTRDTVLRELWEREYARAWLSDRERAEAERLMLERTLEQAERAEVAMRPTAEEYQAAIATAVQTAEKKAAEARARWEAQQARVQALRAQLAALSGDTAAALLKIFTE